MTILSPVLNTYRFVFNLCIPLFSSNFLLSSKVPVYNNVTRDIHAVPITHNPDVEKLYPDLTIEATVRMTMLDGLRRLAGIYSPQRTTSASDPLLTGTFIP